MNMKSFEPVEPTFSEAQDRIDASASDHQDAACNEPNVPPADVDSPPPYGISAEAWAAHRPVAAVTTAHAEVIDDAQSGDYVTTTALVVPDPRISNVPVGWWDFAARPVIEQAADWEQLDDIEAQLLGMASYIEAMDRDSLEFEKALRLVEYRRGQLLGGAEHGGDRQSQKFQVTPKLLEDRDVSRMTASRYRLIARHWGVIYPHLLAQKDRRMVTQRHVLHLIRAQRGERVERSNDVLVSDLTRDLDGYITRLRQRWPATDRGVLVRHLRRVADDIEHEAQVPAIGA
jgi:hypothetical protein